VERLGRIEGRIEGRGGVLRNVEVGEKWKVVSSSVRMVSILV